MKQILLITDGCSNVGSSPVLAAAHALEEGITVNVVGVVDYGTIGELGSQEIDEIAKAGGGISRIVGTPHLAKTMQMMTRKTVVQTIELAVNKELKQILGKGTLTELPPQQRAEVVKVMDNLSETTPLQVALLIDASASMKPKLPAVEEGIRDLMLSLQAREGISQISVFHFPGKHGGEDAVNDIPWTNDVHALRSMFNRLQMRGATPTGPAILKVMDYYRYGTLNEHELISYDQGTKEGMLGDYAAGS
ncbi:hypothetical protein TCA2_5617 [Paenibacillus sp. TCA20]|uniref:VWA domain-containing protein n=1 Tax=Paenibacillus urinalis TaxID=521520 RepID=A0AAX3MYT8_9BACL|nr:MULTISPECIES: VWA domain-containing protein [Paenibacillus]WDH82760.1 VWA domain-containing protein [Paenibacillus urinalis]GAK43122.1 hypothetical protein TCA2_5617 [Paenibacillus sp. TCA20]